MRKPRFNRYMPTPTARQLALLCLSDFREVLYGGAAGGGKSFGLLLAALQYADVPHYAALILRRTFADLSLPGALLDVSQDVLGPTDAVWTASNNTWRFPSGASLTFGYLERDAQKYRYQSSEFQFIGFDELTQFSELQYRYMFSRLRRLKAEGDVPIRMRSASNPGGVGHEWVRSRFIEAREPDRIFLPAAISDNPHLDEREYRMSLANLDPVERERLMNGDWSIREKGAIFQREWFGAAVDATPEKARRVRFWDCAATEESARGDPDWTAGVKLARCGTRYYVEDIKRIRGNGAAVDALIKQTASLDGREVPIRMEQEPGSSGKRVIEYYRDHVLHGYSFRGTSPTGSKLVRAGPVASQAEAGNVSLLRGRWNEGFLDEIEVFGLDLAHDDQVDALSGAFMALAHNAPTPRATSAGRR